MLIIMDKKLPTIREAKRYETNPFVLDLKGKMYLQPQPNTIIAKGENFINTETGELVSDQVFIGHKKVVDRTTFAKIYFSEIATLFDLSNCAKNVLIYIGKTMRYDDKVEILPNLDYAKMGYKSRQSVEKGIRELIDKNIIAAGRSIGTYWVNPIHICKGERFAKYELYMTEEASEYELQMKKDSQFIL